MSKRSGHDSIAYTFLGCRFHRLKRPRLNASDIWYDLGVAFFPSHPVESFTLRLLAQSWL
jgi:hypothetical protein